VVVLGMNFDNFGGLGGHYWVTEDHIAQMKLGKRGKDGRAFARNAMLYLRLVVDHLRASTPSEPLAATNQELARYWEDCAYLQTIKCAPGTARSNPTRAMVETCPKFLLEHELAILEPDVVLLFGRTDLRDVVRPWAVPEHGYGTEQGPRLERDHAEIGDRRVELFSLNHPSGRANHIAASLLQLAESLEKNPLL
jgi:uracil-DNA glycosylase